MTSTPRAELSKEIGNALIHLSAVLRGDDISSNLRDAISSLNQAENIAEQYSSQGIDLDDHISSACTCSNYRECNPPFGRCDSTLGLHCLCEC